MKTVLSLLVLSTFVAFGADATGKWSGTFVVSSDGQSKDSTAYLDLKQEGSKITGTVGPTADEQFPIKSGSIEGSKITLEVTHEEHLMHFELTLDGDRIAGEVKGEGGGGQKMSAKLDVKRTT